MMKLIAAEFAEIWKFGLLHGVYNEVEFEAGILRPLTTHNAIEELVQQSGYWENQTSSIRWLYDTAYQSSGHLLGDGRGMVWIKKEGSERPALMTNPRVTHQIFLKQQPNSYLHEDRLCARFILETLGFLFNCRCQFSDWRLDSRIPIPKRANRYNLGISQLVSLLNSLIHRANALTREQLSHAVNLLYLRNRVDSYDWYWERFTWLFTCLDGSWRLLTDTTPASGGWIGTGQVQTPRGRVAHRARINHMCQQLEMAPHDSDDQQVIDLAVQYRNDLIHEFRIDGETPNYYSGIELARVESSLHSLVNKLLFHVIDVECEYRRRGGWAGNRDLGPLGFDY